MVLKMILPSKIDTLAHDSPKNSFHGSENTNSLKTFTNLCKKILKES